MSFPFLLQSTTFIGTELRHALNKTLRCHITKYMKINVSCWPFAFTAQLRCESRYKPSYINLRRTVQTILLFKLTGI